MEPTEYLAKLADKDAVQPWVAKLFAPDTCPPWVAVGVRIYRNTLSFEARGWQIFICC